MILAAIIILSLAAAVFLFLQQLRFGKAPAGARLQRLQQSPHYQKAQFQNNSHTPALTEGATYTGVLQDFFFGKSKRSKPARPLPSQKTNLLQLAATDNVLVWFGHSSYFLQLDGKTILVDPVLSGSASPVRFTTRSFPGSDVYTTDDLPAIDFLFLSHDHYDHLDHRTLVKLKPKIKTIITGLGVGAHLQAWGFEKDRIIEKDWNETAQLDGGFTVHTTPARHFSGRRFKRNGSLWLSFVLETPTKKIFLGGDSGYDTHFKTIGAAFGPFDLAILENGQYNKSWKYIHMMPEEVVQAAQDLQAKKLLPVHWAKFALALHAWDEPIKRVVAAAAQKGVNVVHPLIGEAVNLDNPAPSTAWWETLP